MPALRPELPALCGLILTCNEQANIARTLAALAWLPTIVVIDSGSSDDTLAILAQHSRVRLLQRPFDSFAGQCNAGLAHIRAHIAAAWVLSLDADHLVPPPLADEIAATLAAAPADLHGLRIPFRYCVAGRPLRGALLPPRVSLYRPAQAHYVDDGHSHRVLLPGRVATLRHPIHHDDRKPLSRWLAAQQRYLPIEADKLLTTPSGRLSPADRLRKHTPLAPLAVLLLCLLLKGGLLDGWRGGFYAAQRLYAELLLWLLLTQRRRIDAVPGSPR